MKSVELFHPFLSRHYEDWYERIREDMAFFWHDYEVRVDKYQYGKHGLLEWVETFMMDAPAYFRLYIGCAERHKNHYTTKGQVMHCRWEGFTYFAVLGHAKPPTDDKMQLRQLVRSTFSLHSKRKNHFYYVIPDVWRETGDNKRILL